jgi:glutamine amidotransferase
MITIVNYGLGNLGSILNMFKKIGVEAEICSEPEQILKARKILLPGVGAFDAAVQKIRDNNLLEVLSEKALKEKVPFLGICLGMQLLTDSSEEGVLPGLGYIRGKTVRFSAEEGLKIPHMGWNVLQMKNPSALTKNMEGEQRFYFVHSFCVHCEDERNIVAQTPYGGLFDSIIQNENIYGTQFHPEKSHRFGMNLLKNFAQI